MTALNKQIVLFTVQYNTVSIIPVSRPLVIVKHKSWISKREFMTPRESLSALLPVLREKKRRSREALYISN